MHHDPAGKILNASVTEQPAVSQHTAAPHPVDHRCVADQHPKAGKQQHKAKPDPLDIGADNQRRCDNRKGHLKGKKQNFRQRA